MGNGPFETEDEWRQDDSLPAKKSNQLKPAIGLTILFGILFFSLIWSTIGSFKNYRDLNLPVTPFGALRALAGTNQTVHVTGKLLGRPTLKATDGELLAYEQLTIESSVRRTNRRIYNGWVPQNLTLTDGNTEVLIRPDHGVATGYLPIRTIKKALSSQLPAEIAALIDPDTFKKVQVTTGQVVTLWTLAQDEPVSVYGSVVQIGNQLVLQDRQGALSGYIIVTPLAAADLVSQSKRTAIYLALALLIDLTFFVLSLYWLMRVFKTSH